jgi:hypothetical protein
MRITRVHVHPWLKVPNEPKESVCDVIECMNHAEWARYITIDNVEYGQSACNNHALGEKWPQ